MDIRVWRSEAREKVGEREKDAASKNPPSIAPRSPGGHGRKEGRKVSGHQMSVMYEYFHSFSPLTPNAVPSSYDRRRRPGQTTTIGGGKKSARTKLSVFNAFAHQEEVFTAPSSPPPARHSSCVALSHIASDMEGVARSRCVC